MLKSSKNGKRASCRGRGAENRWEMCESRVLARHGAQNDCWTRRNTKESENVVRACEAMTKKSQVWMASVQGEGSENQSLS